MPGKTLVILGSGPGIGLSIAKIFSVRGFTHVALVSRDAGRLEKDQDAVLDAVQERGYSCQVKTWTCDISDLAQLRSVLSEIERFGTLECVLFNPARVAGQPPLEESTERIEADFRLTGLGLYEVAKWAIPILKAVPKDREHSPSLLVTSTNQLWKEALPPLFSLSMVKSAQRALVVSLNAYYGKEVHVALVSVGGQVTPEEKYISPDNIAEQAYRLYKQPPNEWTREVEIFQDKEAVFHSDKLFDWGM